MNTICIYRCGDCGRGVSIPLVMLPKSGWVKCPKCHNTNVYLKGQVNPNDPDYKKKLHKILKNGIQAEL